MINLIFTAFYFLLPAGVANSTPVLAAKLPIIKNWNYPLDFNKKLNGKPILGKGKTIRGVIAGILVGVFVFYLERRVYLNSQIIRDLVGIDYGGFSNLNLGIMLSSGALFGDAFKSFIKRRVGVASGDPWIPFDQVDFLIGAIVFSYPFAKLTFKIYLLILVIGIILHLLTNFFAYLLSLKDVPY